MEVKESTLIGIIAVLVVGILLVQAWNFFAAPKLVGTTLVGAQTNSLSSGGIDMTGWTANDKMNYEMHGVIPAKAGGGTASGSGAGMVGSCGGTSSGEVQAGTTTATLSSPVIPTGVPRIYGSELGISFDDVSASNPQKADQVLSKVGALENQISLSGADLQRYIKIASQISCEYCCGAPSIIDSRGNAACSCAHSGAMRGVAKYLIKNHPTEFTDDEILEELGKWKTLAFPGQITQKAAVLEGRGVELNYINLASNKYRGAEAGAGGSGQVGGC